MRARPALLATAILGLAGCSDPDCSIGPPLREHAGKGAKDCGSHRLELGGEVPPELGACYVESFEEGRAFYGWLEGQGIDSYGATGFTSDGSAVWIYDYDSCPSGCGDDDPHLFRRECRGPVVRELHGQPRFLDCEGESETEQVCP